MIFFSVPKNFFAVLSVTTSEYNCGNGFSASPCEKEKVNILKRELSQYLPAAYRDLSLMVKSLGPLSKTEYFDAFTTPGISAFMAAPIGRGVDSMANL